MICIKTYPNYHRFRNVVAVAVSFLLTVNNSIAQTQPAPASLDFDKLAAQPGTKITHLKRGDEDVTELQRGGVYVQVTRRGDKIQTFGDDESGHGAVLCAWQVYIALRAELDTCFPGKYPELRDDISTSIGAMNKFIAKNSLVPTSQKEVEASALAQDMKLRLPITKMPLDQLAEVCQSGSLGKMVIQAAKGTHTQRQKSIDELLSIPRPPVLNPCL
jgi:hypothetical protein